MSRRVVLVVNRSKGEVAARLESELSSVVESGGGTVVAAVDSRDWRGGAVPDMSGVDLAIVLGGDGTLLAVGRVCAASRVPVLGVNLGTLGFLTDFDPETLRAEAAELLGRPVLPTRRVISLETEILLPGGAVDPIGLAINEAVLAADPPFRMIAPVVTFDGEPGPVVPGDGLIISTPTGSTAYNVSAGGPIVAPGVDAMIITPIAAHSLSFRPVVVPASTTIEIALQPRKGREDGTVLVLDGHVHRPIGARERIRIRVSETPLRLVADGGVSYWRTLATKLRWAQAPGGDRGEAGEGGEGA